MARHAKLVEVLASAREKGVLESEDREGSPACAPRTGSENHLHRLLVRRNRNVKTQEGQVHGDENSDLPSNFMHVKMPCTIPNPSAPRNCPVCQEAFTSQEELDRHVEEELTMAIDGGNRRDSGEWFLRPALDGTYNQNQTITIGSRPSRKPSVPKLKKRRTYFNHYEEMRQSIADASSLNIHQDTDVWECGIGTWNLGPKLE